MNVPVLVYDGECYDRYPLPTETAGPCKKCGLESTFVLLTIEGKDDKGTTIIATCSTCYNGLQG